MKKTQESARLQPLQRVSLTRESVWALVVFLVLPVMAAVHLSGALPYYLLPGLMLCFSIGGYLMLAHDKKSAQMARWRIPESRLHMIELLGGWPGSFLAQRRFRHKISKPAYQFSFWLIVVGYQVVAFDCLIDWKFSKQITLTFAQFLQSGSR